MNQYDMLVLEDLVDHAEVSATGGVEPFELPSKRLSGPLGVDCDRIEDRG
jgi:hypothetical protein